MNYRLVEQAGCAAAAQRQKALPSNEQATVEELSRAVGQHALLQAEIDQRIATHIVEMRQELRSMKEEVRGLGAQMDQLIGSLAHALQSSVSQQARAPQANAAERFSLNVRGK